MFVKPWQLNSSLKSSSLEAKIKFKYFKLNMLRTHNRELLALNTSTDDVSCGLDHLIIHLRLVRSKIKPVFPQLWLTAAQSNSF